MLVALVLPVGVEDKVEENAENVEFVVAVSCEVKGVNGVPVSGLIVLWVFDGGGELGFLANANSDAMLDKLVDGNGEADVVLEAVGPLLVAALLVLPKLKGELLALANGDVVTLVPFIAPNALPDAPNAPVAS